MRGEGRAEVLSGTTHREAPKELIDELTAVFGVSSSV